MSFGEFGETEISLLIEPKTLIRHDSTEMKFSEKAMWTHSLLTASQLDLLLTGSPLWSIIKIWLIVQRGTFSDSHLQIHPGWKCSTYLENIPINMNFLTQGGNDRGVGKKCAAATEMWKAFLCWMRFRFILITCRPGAAWKSYKALSSINWYTDLSSEPSEG